MISRLTGILFEKQPPAIGLEVNGVGYQVDVPMSSFYGLPALGQSVVLLTHLIVREDAQQLYGFLTHAERNMFRQLIKISGVGARLALSILSGLSIEDLTQAISQQQAGWLTRIPGIGKKTADRLLLELKDKLPLLALSEAGSVTSNMLGASGASPGDVRADISSALNALGYSEREALAAVKALPAGIDVTEGIRQALKGLSR